MLAMSHNDPQDDPCWQCDTMSIKKLLKGDTCWATHKVILGWVLDSLKLTIKLPPWSGMGGVWYNFRNPTTAAFIWHLLLPTSLVQPLVRNTNPSDTLTNSDLEMATSHGHLAILATTYNQAKNTLVTLDNQATINWYLIGFTPTASPGRFILHNAALHQFQHW